MNYLDFSIPDFTGDILRDQKTLAKYSIDASLFQVMPSAVVVPKTVQDICATVAYISDQKKTYSELSCTVRSQGTCMSGGPLSESIVIDTALYINTVGAVKYVQINDVSAPVISADPGAVYREFETVALRDSLEMPVYPASKAIAGIGGMFGNNCGGEKSLEHGKAANWIAETKHVFSDGKEYLVKPLSSHELEDKIAQNDFEGDMYKKLRYLIQSNYQVIQSEKPKVSKNSAGYYLWNVWNRETGVFDLNQLLCGSQGTLGIATNITWKLTPLKPAAKMIVIMLPELTNVGEVVSTLLQYSPSSIESYDDHSMKLAVKFFPDFIKQLGIIGAVKLGWQFIPEIKMMIRGGMPKLIIVAEFTGETDAEIDERLYMAYNAVRKYSYQTHIPATDAEEMKYWRIRRESFNLLRKHLSGQRTAPCIDDVCVDPKHLPEFLPKLSKILEEYNLTYTVAGHAGNGNFHIIPLMDFRSPKTRDIILELSDKVYTLVQEFSGSITAEHNDGIVRTPYLHYMFSPKMLDLFQQVKNIFDPQNIFNPGKKVGGSIEYLKNHIKRE
jgi:FAD/FMN-containing dehydrogenase